MKAPKSVLFVCFANINRSTTAEWVFKRELEKRGYKEGSGGLENEIKVNSAGTYADMEVNSTQLTIELGDEYERIFTFSRNLRYEIIHKFNQAPKKVTNMDIPDVYHCGEPALIEICRKKLQPYMNRWYHSMKQ